MPVRLQFGDIVNMRRARDIEGGRKLKIVVCVEPGEYWFFYINSKRYSFAANDTIELRPEDLDRLEHISYLDMHSVKTADMEEVCSIDTSQIYRFNNDTIYRTMMYKIETSRMLSQEKKDKIRACYEAFIAAR